MNTYRPYFWICASVLGLVVLIFFALSVGKYEISFIRVLELLCFPDESRESFVLWQSRIPRVLGAVAIGASLALSGALYQGVIGNPLVSPGILGVLNGASFGAALGMILGFNLLGIEIVCFVFGFLAMCVALLLSYIFDGYKSLLMLILGGVISSAFFGAGVSCLKLLADPYNTLPNIVFWLMGSLAYMRIAPLIVLCIILLMSVVFCVYFSKHIDIITIDEESAATLGVDVQKVRLLFIVLATLLASSSVALGGLIGWIGLVIPHIARFLLGATHRYMLIFCVLFGGFFLLSCDTLARSVSEVEIPIGILTSLFLIPIFAFVLFINKKRQL